MAENSSRPSSTPSTLPIGRRSTRSPLLPLALLLPLLLISLPLLLPSPPRATIPPRSEYYKSTLQASMHSPPQKLRIGSFNIRYDRASKYPHLLLQPIEKALSSIPSVSSSPGGKKDKNKWGEHPWPLRREKLVDQVLFHELDVVGFQEVLDGQYEDLRGLLGEEEWGSVGVGRDDGNRAGEAVPIFYRRSRLSLLSSLHFWLSPTPSLPGSKGWDAGQPRMVTVGFFRLLPSSTSTEGKGEEADLVVLNTHWDDRGLLARTESAKLILREVAELTSSTSSPSTSPSPKRDPLILLLGDLNSPAPEEGYQVLTGRRYLKAGKEVVVEKEKVGEEEGQGEEKGGKASFYDARHELARRGTRLEGPGAMSGRFGPLNTFTGFTPSDSPKVIDFILLYSNSAFLPSSTNLVPCAEEEEKLGQQKRWKVHRYGVVPNFFEDIGGKRGEEGDGMVVSDHRLVVVGLEEVVGL